MKTHETNDNISVKEHHDSQIITILFALGSFLIIGVIPFIYGLSLTPESQIQNGLPTEFYPWNVSRER